MLECYEEDSTCADWVAAEDDNDDMCSVIPSATLDLLHGCWSNCFKVENEYDDITTWQSCKETCMEYDDSSSAKLSLMTTLFVVMNVILFL